MSLTVSYTVTEYALRHADGRIESLGTDDHFRLWKATKAAMFGRGRHELVCRQVTGRDPVFDGGLFAGVSVPKVKDRYAAHPGCPSVVESATDWEVSS